MAKKEPDILLVDDDKDMCDSLADVLKLDTNYEVSTSSNPIKALELVKNNNYALIIVDYKMPEMNGLELLKLIKENKPDCKIFILTAFISNELIEQAKKAGATKVLSKFIWPDEIIAHIKEVI